MGNTTEAEKLLAFNVAVAERVTKTLEIRGLSVAWLSTQAAIPRTTLDRVLADPMQLSLGQAGKIAVALDLDQRWLLTGTPTLADAA